MVRRNRRLSALEKSVTIIATICCLPCICLVGGGIITKDLFVKARNYERPRKRRERESKERKREMMRSTPKRLCPRLEKHLTIGRPEPEDTEEEVDLEDNSDDAEVVKLARALTVTHGQEKSGLFKLPFEIRRKIYEDTLGGYVFHIYFREAYRKMSHMRCKDGRFAEEVCRGTLCRKHLKLPGVPDQWGNTNLLSLLQSCRRIYSEAIDILYTANIFDFDSLNDVLKLSLTLLPERMHLMETVQWKPTVASVNYLTNKPWLQCDNPLPCCCISCWPKVIGLDEAQINRYQISIFEFPLPKTGWRICSET